MSKIKFEPTCGNPKCGGCSWCDEDYTLFCIRNNISYEDAYDWDREKRFEEALRRIALEAGSDPAKDFEHCVVIARHALYPE